MNSALVNGFGNSIAQGGQIAVLAVFMVFAILLLIILLSEGVGSLVNKMTPVAEAPCEEAAPAPSADVIRQQLNLDDEDAVVAALVASIDYRNETKKNIQVLSVKEVK